MRLARLVYSLLLAAALLGEPVLAQGTVALGVGVTQPVGSFHDGFLRGPFVRGELGLTAPGWDWLILRAEAHRLPRTFGPGHAALVTVVVGAKHALVSWRVRASELRLLPEVALGGSALDPSGRDWTPDFGVHGGVAVELPGEPVGVQAFIGVTHVFAGLSYRYITMGVVFALR